MPVVDSHLHVWRAAEGDTGSLKTIVPPQADVPIELARETMAEHEVDRAVLVQPVFRGEDNSYVADCARAEPQKFAAVCYVDPRKPDAATRLAHWVGQGCRGLRMRPRLPDEASLFGDPVTHPLWQAAADANVVVSLLASVEHAPTIAKLAERFPSCAIVVDHLGHPNSLRDVSLSEFRPILDLARHERVYLKISGFHHFSRKRFPYRDCQELVRAAYEHFGSKRLLWGSDFPHVLLASSYARCRLLVDAMLGELSEQEREAVFGGNAQELYWRSLPSHWQSSRSPLSYTDPMSNERLSDDLDVLVRDHFSGQADEAREILLHYSGREVDRVRRAILALAQGSLERLAYNTEQALQDYRDVLYWAEYPDESGGHETPGAQI